MSEHMERFEKEKHYAQVALWWEDRGTYPVPLELIPAVGYIVPNVAAGFLYQTDGGIALIENLIANPDSEVDERDHALDAIVDALCEDAKGLGYHGIYGFTQVPKVVQRATDHGFVASDDAFWLVTRRF